jgi:hypothetical protein
MQPLWHALGEGGRGTGVSSRLHAVSLQCTGGALLVSPAQLSVFSQGILFHAFSVFTRSGPAPQIL